MVRSRMVTAETGMGGDGPQFSAVGSDFNNDRAVDFVVAGKNARVLLNPREGKFPAACRCTCD